MPLINAVRLRCMAPPAPPKTGSFSTYSTTVHGLTLLTQKNVWPAAAGRAFLDRYCTACHNERLKTAGLVLDTSDVEHLGKNPEMWEKVVRKLRAGAMPPAGLPRPDNVSYDSFANYLENG